MRRAHVATLAAIVAVTSSACGASVRSSDRSPLLDHPLAFALPSSDGGELVVPTRDGSKLVLDFFSPYCEPCKTKLPELWTRKAAIEARGARLVLVAMLHEDEPPALAEKALASWGVRAPFLVDHDGSMREKVGVARLPTTMIVDERGTLRWIAPEDATSDEVVAALR